VGWEKELLYNSTIKEKEGIVGVIADFCHGN